MSRWKTWSMDSNAPVRAAYVVPALLGLTIAAISATAWIKNLATDDALYYPTVARSIASGLGSTYDGFTQTNGYHPLWCWLQIPIAALTSPLGDITYLWFVKLLVVIVAALAVIVWGQLIRRVTGSSWMAATFVLLLGAYWWSVHTLYSGMETPLVVLMMGVALLLAHRLLENHSTRTAVALGVAMAATLLARLDSVFFLGVLGCVVLLRLRKNIKVLAAWLIPMVSLPLPYLWWNYTVFGNFVPVSGIRKSVSTLDLEAQLKILTGFASGKLTKLTTVLNPAALMLVALVAILFVTAMWLSRSEIGEQARRLNLLWTVPVGAVLHFLYIATFMVEANVSWYQYSEYLTLFLAISVAVASVTSWLQARRLPESVQWLPFGVVVAGVLTSVLAFAPKALPDIANVRSYETASWAKEHLDSADVRFGMYDPGVFRFVSGFKTMALNGLASTPEVTALVLDGNWTDIIAKYNINYVVQFVAEQDIAAIPQQYVKFRTEPFEKYLWRYDAKMPGRFLILDSSYPGINSLI
ncbi:MULTISPECIES: hypothetical protein [unclassified Mycolicibacterium]|uniref:hypothetical protein n=1 Tax=unclassified Mycolicibacterium TaxID=2636767 RepID=UPI001F4C1283|nr:hypothetical protein [Mycolicibacterium sp. YH-1]UNB51882.1 hypothetical protein L0M16_29025 [Mycolicibacterium sp. YH-1]